jgi:hypothetical protein
MLDLALRFVRVASKSRVIWNKYSAVALASADLKFAGPIVGGSVESFLTIHAVKVLI